MYNEKIENLIKAALADGVLTEKEKQILFKNAQAQGIDLDEFEMVLDARLVELEKAEKEKVAKSAPKSEKYGDVRKCPVCGALVPALGVTCAECGYELSGVKSILSSTQLAAKLEEIQELYNKKYNEINGASFSDDDARWEIKKQQTIARSQAIRNFSIPNAKADLFEFITSMQAQMTSECISKVEGEAYVTKYKEAIIKSKAISVNDPQLARIVSDQENVLAEYKKVRRKQKGFGLKPSTKSTLYVIIGFILVSIILVILDEFDLL